MEGPPQEGPRVARGGGGCARETGKSGSETCGCRRFARLRAPGSGRAGPRGRSPDTALSERRVLERKLWLVSHLSVAAARAGGSPVTCQQMCLMMTDPGTQYFLQLTKVPGHPAASLS
ncbi:Tetratricopeptide Repeat Protein 13 [Manis pentadactyla]|nr:Tetratricopeptide Repeat Protein 13 [Manis pentadactyla]